MDWPPIDWTVLSRDVTGALALLSFVAQIPFVRDVGKVLVGMLQDYREHLDEQREAAAQQQPEAPETSDEQPEDETQNG